MMTFWSQAERTRVCTRALALSLEGPLHPADGRQPPQAGPALTLSAG